MIMYIIGDWVGEKFIINGKGWRERNQIKDDKRLNKQKFM